MVRHRDGAGESHGLRNCLDSGDQGRERDYKFPEKEESKESMEGREVW